MFGYVGRILRVDLSTQSFSFEKLDEKLAFKYIGANGFGIKYLYSESTPQIDPFSPQAPLIFATGPFTGTSVPSGSKCAVFAKSPQTGLLGESYVSGDFGPQIKYAGNDVIIVKGKSRTPSYLYVNDDMVLIRPADHLWGLDSWKTIDAIKQETEPQSVSIGAIGPAGENQVVFACITFDYGRQAGRTGMGSVMGSKNLKAIAVHGTRGVKIADQANFTREITRLFKLASGPVLENMRTYGTPNLVEVAQGLEVLPTRNWQEAVFEQASLINAEAVAKICVRKKACFGCPVGCANITQINEGPYTGTIIEGPEYETLFALGSNCGLGNLSAITKANELCDRLGLDTMSTGSIIALVLHCIEEGRLKNFKSLATYSFGNENAILELIEMIAYQRGIGDQLAKGTRFFAKRFGLEDLSMEVKGLELPGYDCRSLPGMGLGYAVSNRGGCHLRSIAVFDVDLAGDRYAWKGKGTLVAEKENYHTLCDCLPFCKFVRKITNFDELTNLYSFVTGNNISSLDMKTAMERVTTLERLFNIREGATKEDDTLPERILRSASEQTAATKHIISRQVLDSMISDYYSARGWSPEGHPTAETLERLNLKDELRGRG